MCLFGSKNRNFSYPLIFRAPKRSKFRKLLDFEIFRSIWPSEVQERTPLTLCRSHESDILNRQSGGDKLKYVLKFYIGVDITHVISRMRNDDLALCQ